MLTSRYDILRRASLTVASGTAAGLLLLTAAPAAGVEIIPAQDDEEDNICPPGQRTCSIEREDPGDPDNPGDDSPGGGGGEDEVCTWGSGGDDDGVITVSFPVAAQSDGVEVPCYIERRGWYDGTDCYWGEPGFNFDTTPPDGKSEDDGQWYQLHCIWDVTNGVVAYQALYQHQWLDYGGTPQISPEELARAIAEATLEPVSIQLAPPESGAGLVSLPVWLGVDESAENMWGPIGASDCVGDLCVSIDAQVTEVEWDLGDGTVFTCDRGQHKVWQPDDDFRFPGSNCHHVYQRSSDGQPDGRYPITATSVWTVSWETTSGPDDSGELTDSRESSTSIQINEIQVLTTE